MLPFLLSDCKLGGEFNKFYISAPQPNSRLQHLRTYSTLPYQIRHHYLTATPLRPNANQQLPRALVRLACVHRGHGHNERFPLLHCSTPRACSSSLITVHRPLKPGAAPQSKNTGPLRPPRPLKAATAPRPRTTNRDDQQGHDEHKKIKALSRCGRQHYKY